MMRSSPMSSMQKTYDQCYIICSTAVYFEKQNNEDEALRSWREALDQIYYNNAFRIPASYAPKNETERALRDSLREMELQCKERVSLLEALRKSRDDANKPAEESNGVQKGRNHGRKVSNPTPKESASKVSEGTVPTMSYPDFARPAMPPKRRSGSNPIVSPSAAQSRTASAPDVPPKPALPPRPPVASPPTLDAPGNHPSRTPSPDKKGGMFKSTLRPQRPDATSRGSTGRLQMTMRTKSSQPAAGKAASLAWPNASQTTLVGDSTASPSTLNNTLSATPHHSRAPSPAPASPRNPAPNSNTSKPAPAPPPHRDLQRAARRKPDRPTYDTNAKGKANGSHKDDISSLARGEPSRTEQIDPPASPPMSQSLKMPEFPTYRREYVPNSNGIDAKRAQAMAAQAHGNSSEVKPEIAESARRHKPPGISRKAVPLSPRNELGPDLSPTGSSESANERLGSKARRRRATEEAQDAAADFADGDEDGRSPEDAAWDAKAAQLLKNIPKGVDEQAAKSILNEIVIKGDVVTWEDVAGLDIAKTALKEAVVYPFLRPDLFMGLREPARGMLLFGPPGTGKTMLARAVATMSKSTFFSISASSLTSKFLGESEKLVRALFAIAKALAPSIIFVDEIDSLLSSRSGSGEHEATRRIKTEFLIQWSDLQKAAAGREEKDKSFGDATRVLVLAATNLPWAIDEAARRRFVRRQYIPLPEGHVRKDQLHRLMEKQKNSLKADDYEVLVHLTEGFSGSDITALAKDAAMGPLRSLGEQLLHMSPEDIRPIGMQDFEASLVNIRPSVSQQGLKEYEDWARDFGERGG